MPDLHVPEKAVEVLYQQVPELVQGSGCGPFAEKEACRVALQAALPAIYEQRDREWREWLLSEDEVRAALDAHIEALKQIRCALQAAIAAAFPGEGE